MAPEELAEPGLSAPGEGEVALGTEALSLRILCTELGGRPVPHSKAAGVSVWRGREAHFSGCCPQPREGRALCGASGGSDLSALSGEGSFSLCWRKLTDGISSAIVSLPSQREIYADPSRSRAESSPQPHPGLAGQRTVGGALRASQKRVWGSSRPVFRTRGWGSVSQPFRCDSSSCRPGAPTASSSLQ